MKNTRTLLLILPLLASTAFAADVPKPVVPAPAPSAVAVPAPSAAAVQTPAASAAPVTAADVARIEQYLSGITTLSADFSQTAANGKQSKGKFYLKRPGKMRWEYAAPSNILLVSNGTTVTFYDPSVDQVSFVPVDDTLAGFLAQKDIRLESPSTHMTKLEKKDGMVRVTLVQVKKPTDGSLTLEFSDKPLELRQMQVTDATGQTTIVALANAQFGPVFDDKLFKFVDPRGVNYRRDKRS